MTQQFYKISRAQIVSLYTQTLKWPNVEEFLAVVEDPLQITITASSGGQVTITATPQAEETEVPGWLEDLLDEEDNTCDQCGCNPCECEAEPELSEEDRMAAEAVQFMREAGFE